MAKDTNDNSYPTVLVETDGYITMASPDGRKTYALLKRVTTTSGESLEVNCVESYVLTGGPLEPFESLSLKIPKKKLLDISKDFEKPNSIVPGKTRISVNYIGHCDNMVVTKCKLSGNNYNITAYHECETIKGLTFISDYEANDPLEVVNYILKELDAKLGVTDRYSSANHQVFIYDQSFTSKETMHITRGRGMWDVLQLCAYVLGCRVFFSGDIVYMVDYRLPFANDYSEDGGIRDHFTLDLYGSTGTISLRKTLVSTPEYGQEGFDTVANSVEVVLNSSSKIGEYNMPRVYVSDAGSIERYGERVASPLNANIFNILFGTVVGSTYIGYLAEPQQSITFETKELVFDNDAENYGMAWVAQFPKVTRVGRIIDSNAEVTLSNEDVDGVVHPQKLYLAQYSRNFPEGTSTYSFGVMESINLSQSTSKIMTAIGGI